MITWQTLRNYTAHKLKLGDICIGRCKEHLISFYFWLILISVYLRASTCRFLHYRLRSSGSGHLNEKKKKKKKRNERLNGSKFRNYPRGIQNERYARYPPTFSNEFNARLRFEKGKVPASSRAVGNVELPRESVRTFTSAFRKIIFSLRSYNHFGIAMVTYTCNSSS